MEKIWVKYNDWVNNFIKKNLPNNNWIDTVVIFIIPLISLSPIFIFGLPGFILSLIFLIMGTPLIVNTKYRSDLYRNSSERYRRKGFNKNTIFYRFVDIKGKEIGEWYSIDLTDEYDKNYYYNFIRFYEKSGVVKIEKGGLTEVQKKIKNRNNKIKSLLNEKS